MAIKFGKTDLLQAAGVTVSAGSEALPAENAINRWPSKQWRTSSDAAGQWIGFHLPATSPADYVALINPNLAGASGGASASLWHCTDPTFTGETRKGEIPFYTAATTLMYFFTSTSAKHWRVKFTDNTSTGDIRLGRIMLGVQFSPSSCVATEHAIEPVDPSRIVETEDGQLHTDERTVYFEHGVNLRHIDHQEFANLMAVTRDLQKDPTVIAIYSEDTAAVDWRYSTVYGSIMKPPSPIRRGVTWVDVKFTVREWV